MKDKIRLGIIGCGGIARSRHMTGLTSLKQAGLDNFEVTAVCDVVDDNVQAVAAHARERQGANPQIYHDWEELVCKASVDAVDICLPHGMHHVVGISCLDAGLDVIVEKPYTVSIKTGRFSHSTRLIQPRQPPRNAAISRSGICRSLPSPLVRMLQ